MCRSLVFMGWDVTKYANPENSPDTPTVRIEREGRQADSQIWSFIKGEKPGTSFTGEETGRVHAMVQQRAGDLDLLVSHGREKVPPRCFTRSHYIPPGLCVQYASITASGACSRKRSRIFSRARWSGGRESA